MCDREYDPRKAARRLPARRISARSRDDRHGRAPQGIARDARAVDWLSGAGEGGLILSHPRHCEERSDAAISRYRPYAWPSAGDCFASPALTMLLSVSLYRHNVGQGTRVRE